MSFLPVTPRFTFNQAKLCVLHEILFEFKHTGRYSKDSYAPSLTLYTNKGKKMVDSFTAMECFTFYINNYYLKDNNYLQNEKGDTPLHIAYYYNNKWAILKLEKSAPEMKNIMNNNGILPKDMIYEYMPIEIDYPQDMEEWGGVYLARY